MIKSGYFNNILYFIDIVCGWVFHKSPCLWKDTYICELPNLHNLCTTTLFVDHHPDNPSILEDITTFCVCKHYHPSHSLKWNHHLAYQILQFAHTTWLQTHHFDNIIRLGTNRKFLYIYLIQSGWSCMFWLWWGWDRCVTSIINP